MVIILLISILGISPVFGFINIGRSDTDGCLRGGVYYAEGASVLSDERCKDCVCTDGEVKCTTEVCRGARNNCKKVGFIKGTCCPLKFECDDEINQLIPETPFSNSDVKTFTNTHSAKTCISRGLKYFSGQSVPAFSPCQSSCACVDGSIACTHSACPPAPPAFLRCSKLEDSNECCATYSCSSTRNTNQTLGCEYKGIRYEDEDFVPNSDPCSECYCWDGEVVCATQECPEPPASNCRPVTSSHETCCPQKYECLDVSPEESDTAETPITTEKPFENMESTTTNEDLASTNVEDIDVVTDAAVDVNEVTENNAEVVEEKQTTAVVDEGTEASTTTSDDFTTAEPITSKDSTQEESINLTTESLEDEFTTLSNIEEYTESVTEQEQTTSSYDEIDITTASNLDETPIETTSSTSISIEETTLDSSTDDNTVKEELVTDEVTTESSSDYYTVTEDDMMTETTTIAFGEMCSSDGNVYSDGESISPTSQCQESCHCRNGTVTCIEKACTPAPPAFLRCASVEVINDSDECCPKYNCPSISPSPESPDCMKDGIQYYEGEFVPSANLCTDCYCLYGEILCAFLECAPPVRNSCAPLYDDERTCCPQYYECDIEGDMQTTTMYQTTEEPEESTDFSLFRCLIGREI